MRKWLKRVFNADKYNDASIRVLDNMGPGNSSYPPFNYNVAVRSFRSWVYAASWINASAVAATPLRLYMRGDSGRKSLWKTRPVHKSRRSYMLGDGAGDIRPSQTVMRKVMEMGDQMEEVTESHPIIELLQKANHVYNGFDLTLLRTLYQELTGNAYMHVIMDPQLDVPSELWPMPSQWVQVVPDRDRFVAGYTYGRTEVEQLHFERDEVVHFKRPNPDNLFYGMGKVEAAYGVVKANEAVHDMDLATFENHARPDYAVVVNGPHRRADLDVFEQHVTERLRGTRKSGQFLAVSGDVNFTPLNFPPKDLGGREEIVEEIAAVFGVPVSMMKANDPNLASARAGFSQWRESTILPMLRMDEDVLNQVLLPMFGIEGDACLAYDNPVPADSAFELQQRQTAVAGGWMTLNEARLEQGLTASENPMADELLQAGQALGTPPPDPFAMGQMSEDPGAQDEPDPYDVESMKSVLKSVGNGELSAHAGIQLCKKIGMKKQEAEEAVLSQVRIAQEMRRTKAVEPTHLDVYSTAEEAEARAEELGCSGFHMHETEEGQTVYMPCSDMSDYTDQTGLAHAKAIADVELKPTATMAGLAERGLKLREEHGRGGTAVGVARARDISNRENLSPETIGRMASFFARHRVDLDAPAANPGHAEYPSAGVIAWLLWGGDPSDPDGAGAAWAEMKQGQLDREKEKNASSPLAKPEEQVTGKAIPFPGKDEEEDEAPRIGMPRRMWLLNRLDLNGDGRVTLEDYLLMAQAIGGGSTDLIWDFDGDGVITIDDINAYGDFLIEYGGFDEVGAEGLEENTDAEIEKLVNGLADSANDNDKPEFSDKYAMRAASIVGLSLGRKYNVLGRLIDAINERRPEEPALKPQTGLSADGGIIHPPGTGP